MSSRFAYPIGGGTVAYKEKTSSTKENTNTNYFLSGLNLLDDDKARLEGIIGVTQNGGKTINDVVYSSHNAVTDHTSLITAIGALDAALNLVLNNKIINGSFLLWTRGTSFNAAGYTSDRWYCDLGTGGTPAFTVTQQTHTLGQTSVEANPKYYLEFAQSAAATANNPYIEQRIENVLNYSGQTITVSFYAKVASGTLTVTPNLQQNFGTSGSPSATVSTNASANITLTNAWQRFNVQFTVPSVSGKVLGSDNNDYISFRLIFPLNTTFTADVSQVMVTGGTAIYPYIPQDRHTTQAQCERYYQKYTGCKFIQRDSSAGAGNTMAQNTHFIPTTMRAAPTATTSNVSYTNGQSISITGITPSSYNLQFNTDGTAGLHEVNYDIALNAEL